jgi:hypothetical protein
VHHEIGRQPCPVSASIMPNETPRQRYEREWAAVGFESDEYLAMLNAKSHSRGGACGHRQGARDVRHRLDELVLPSNCNNRSSLNRWKRCLKEIGGAELILCSVPADARDARYGDFKSRKIGASLPAIPADIDISSVQNGHFTRARSATRIELTGEN